jgi:hypothetical protein
MDIRTLPYFDGFGYNYNGQYFADQAQLDDWLQRDQVRTQNNKLNDEALLRQWGAPAGMNVWDAGGQVLRAGYGSQYNQQNPTATSNPYGGTTTSWGYQPPTTSWSTPNGNNSPAPGSSVSVPQPNTSGQGGSNGFLPDYYQTGNNPYRGGFTDNNPNLRVNMQEQSYGQLPYLMKS